MKKKKGFSYYIDIEKIREYQAAPIERRLMWLYQGNLLRMKYPRNIIELQEKFRKGEI